VGEDGGSIAETQRSLQMCLEELCMPEGNANGLNTNHVACMPITDLSCPEYIML
jgi:hypothetical protein